MDSGGTQQAADDFGFEWGRLGHCGRQGFLPVIAALYHGNFHGRHQPSTYADLANARRPGMLGARRWMVRDGMGTDKADTQSGGRGSLAEAPPHYLSHRARLRQRFREAGAETLPDYELLEMVL